MNKESKTGAKRARNETPPSQDTHQGVLLTNKEYERHAVAARYSARHTPKGDFDEQGVENASEENPGRRSTTSLRRHAAIARYTPRGAVDEQGVQASRRRRPLQCMPSLAVEVKRTYGGGRRGGRGCGVCNGLTPVRPCIGATLSPLARIDCWECSLRHGVKSVRRQTVQLSFRVTHSCCEELLDDHCAGKRSRQMTQGLYKTFGCKALRRVFNTFPICLLHRRKKIFFYIYEVLTLEIF